MDTVFDIAAFGSYEDMIMALVGQDARMINAMNENGYTLAGNAAQFGNVDTLAALQEAGADLNLCNRDTGGEPPIQAALVHEHLNAIKFLLEKGVDLNAPGWMEISGWQCLRKFISHYPNALSPVFYAKYADSESPVTGE